MKRGLSFLNIPDSSLYLHNWSSRRELTKNPRVGVIRRKHACFGNGGVKPVRIADLTIFSNGVENARCAAKIMLQVPVSKALLPATLSRPGNTVSRLELV